MSDDMLEVPGEPLICFLDFSLSSPRVLLGAALLFPLLELKKANELDVAALGAQPGWGIDVDEEGVARHPSRRPEWHDGGSAMQTKL